MVWCVLLFIILVMSLVGGCFFINVNFVFKDFCFGDGVIMFKVFKILWVVVFVFLGIDVFGFIFEFLFFLCWWKNFVLFFFWGI